MNMEIMIFLTFTIPAFLFALMQHKKRKEINDEPTDEYIPQIKMLIYECGADEQGGFTHYLLKEHQLNYVYYDETGEESAKATYYFSDEYYEILWSIVETNEIKKLADSPKDEMQIQDGPVTSIRVEFLDGAVVELSNRYSIPANGHNAIKDISEFFYCIKSDNETE